MLENNDKITIPKKVFIVPYRNRIQHKFFFSKYMSFILEDKKDYEIYFSHQCDARTFNRGAVKNIGFIAIKNKYPEHYKNITFIFNDIDTIPFHKIFDYETILGTVKHYYGFKYALGGIVVMKGADFEKINGFPCYWGWGMEDNALQKRCERNKLTIDRSNFYEIGNPQILQLFDGISRIISKKDPWRSENDNGFDGLRTISKLQYAIDSKSDNPNDNIYNLDDPRIFFINIKTFLTYLPYEGDEYFNYDLREPKRKIIRPDKIRQTKQVVGTTDDWSNIPFYPTNEKKQEMIQQYGKQNAEQIIEYSYENSTDPTMETLPPQLIERQNNNQQHYQQQQQHYQQQQQQQQQVSQQISSYQDQLVQIQRYNEYMRQINSNQRIIPPNVNKFSPAYSRIIASRPKAGKSANIRLGGVY